MPGRTLGEAPVEEIAARHAVRIADG
jgi:hypothetical protein